MYAYQVTDLAEVECIRIWITPHQDDSAEYAYTLRDVGGNVLIYRRIDSNAVLREGDQAHLRATVKKHYTSKYGVQTTVINRPKFTPTAA